MPAPSAEVVLPEASGCPSISMVPRSAASAPEMILMRVDLPAPFSPTMACTSPATSSKSTPRRACTPPYRFSTPVSRRTAGPLDERSVSPSGCVVVMSAPRPGPGRRRGHGGPVSGSVVELVDVVGRDAQGRAQKQRLGGCVVRRVRDLGLEGGVGVERLAGGKLVAGPRGEVAQLLDVPEDGGAGRPVGEVG